MKLVKFLEKYLTDNRDKIVSRGSGDYGSWNTTECKRLIQAGIEAFASTENVTVEVINGRAVVEERY